MSIFDEIDDALGPDYDELNDDIQRAVEEINQQWEDIRTAAEEMNSKSSEQQKAVYMFLWVHNQEQIAMAQTECLGYLQNGGRLH